MADNQSKFSMSTVTTKQKVIGVATVIIVIFLIYEIVEMFSGGGSAPAVSPAPAAAPKPMSAANPTAQTPGAAPAMQTDMRPAQPAAAVMPNSGQVTSVTAAPASKDTETMKAQDLQQKAYLDSLNQLQLLKLKRDIAETNQAIATARLATETANKSMSDLLTTPAAPAVPAANYLNNLGTPPGGPPGQGAQLITEPDSQIKPPPVAETPYVVISVSMQFERWTAVLGYQNKLYSISVGDTLEDGSTVASINRTGVVIVKDGKRRKLNIISSI
jgi:hypothetical protein